MPAPEAGAPADCARGPGPCCVLPRSSPEAASRCGCTEGPPPPPDSSLSGGGGAGTRNGSFSAAISIISSPYSVPVEGYGGGGPGGLTPLLRPRSLAPLLSARAALLFSPSLAPKHLPRSAPHSPARPQDTRETRTTRGTNRACADPFLPYHYRFAASAHCWRAFLSSQNHACALCHHPGRARIRVRTNLTAPGL